MGVPDFALEIVSSVPGLFNSRIRSRFVPHAIYPYSLGFSGAPFQVGQSWARILQTTVTIATRPIIRV